MIYLSNKVGWKYKDKLLLELVFSSLAAKKMSVFGSYFRNLTLSHQKVEVTVNERKKTYQTDAFGNLVLELKGLPTTYNIIFEIKGHQIILDQEEFYQIAPSDDLIISDIDDTILRSHTLYPLKQLFYTLMPVRTRKVIPNVQKFLISMKGEDKHVVYVSNSSMNLKNYLLKFMDTHDFPKGPLLLNDYQTLWTLIRDKLRGKKQIMNYKKKRIERLMSFLEECRFGLIGDNSQQDPQVFLSIAQQFADRVNFVAVRKAVLSSSVTIQEMFDRADKKNLPF